MKDFAPRPNGAPTRRSPAAGPQGHGLVRAVNQQLVLETLLHHGPTSRAAIARATGLSKPTVSAVVRDLEASGLVRGRGRLNGSVGRSSTLYEMNPRGGYVFAADIGGSKTRVGLTDLYGETAAERVEPTTRDGALAVVAQIRRLYDEVRGEAGIDEAIVRAAGISVPGVIDPGADRVSDAFSVPGLDSVRPAAEFEAALGLPVVLGNDVNLAALGERWRGRAAGVDDFVAFSIGTGVGAGIVAGGELYIGARGAAGEIGFLPLARDPFDPAHRAGGPFEASASGPHVLDRLVRARGQGRFTAADPKDGVAGIFAAAAAADALATELVEDEARWVALAIAAVAAVLDPRLVVLGGDVGSNPGLIEPVRRELARLIPRPPAVEVTSLDDRAPFFGAIAVALQVAREQLLAETRGTPIALGARDALPRAAGGLR